MSNINENLEKIQNAIYGEEVRKAIVDSIKNVYEDAAKEGNANMEVEAARGAYGTLKERLDTYDFITFQILNTETQINKNENFELPISYKVDNDSLSIFFEGCKLVKNVNYIEVGKEESNVIQFKDWDVPKGSNLEIKIKGISGQTEVINEESGEKYTLKQLLEAIQTTNGISSIKTDKNITISGEKLETIALSKEEIEEITDKTDKEEKNG